MRVKCKENRREEAIKTTDYDIPKEDFNFTVGKEYTVYALSQYEIYTIYFLCKDSSDRFPIPKPFVYFDIIDPRPSRYWIVSFLEYYSSSTSPLLLRMRMTFPEWANEDYFSDKLTDYEDREVEIFATYKELMDLEFPDKSISEKAEIGDEKWLICPTCMDAWEESNQISGMVRCPKCKKMMHNPRYKENFLQL